MTEIIRVSPDTIARAKEKFVTAIKRGDVIAYPTDTVYGIGGDATNSTVVNRIYDIKRRSDNKPLSVAFSDFYMLSKYCTLTENQEAVIKKYAPGPYTFIIKATKKVAASSTDLLGIRIPAYDFLREVIAAANLPLITTSANISGQDEVFDFSSLNQEILDKCDLGIDGGATKYKQASTVVDLIHNRLLRKGAGAWDK